jgi:HSP20 family protein
LKEKGVTKEKQTIPVTSEKATGKSSVPLHPLAEIERAFDRLRARDWWSPARPLLPSWDALLELNGHRVPKMDVLDRDSEIIVRAEIPGMDKKDISISLTDNLLTIKGQSHSEKREEKGDYHWQEISSAEYTRSITLPGAVDTAKSVAVLKDGILEVTLPKLERSRRKNIVIK